MREIKFRAWDADKRIKQIADYNGMNVILNKLMIVVKR